MSDSTVVIVGSGIAATAIAHHLTENGHDVVIFEKGPDYPYPHSQQYREDILFNYTNPAWKLGPDLKNLTISGDYRWDLNDYERGMVVGGSATHWSGMTPRMRPTDFERRSRFGYGLDWPLRYADLEPYYCKAETLMGVSGTDADNPYAPPRSRAFPLPPFALSYGDRILAQRLKRSGIVLHTTPQARTRVAYDGRPGCQNFGVCETCPIGVRYSPNHHLLRAQATGRCRIVSNASVRRVLLGADGTARAVVYRSNAGGKDLEHGAKAIVIAAGAIETPRLLLLSKEKGHPDGVGNRHGHVGRHLTFHHAWYGVIEYDERLSPGEVGAFTGLSSQFCDPPAGAGHGGILTEFSSSVAVPGDYFSSAESARGPRSGAEVLAQMRAMPFQRLIGLQAESVPDEGKYVALSEERDRFGDPFAHVHYQSSEFDRATYAHARSLYDRFVKASGGEAVGLRRLEEYDSGAHHMGTCRMGNDPQESVVDSHGRVHGVPNLFVAGSAVFVGASGAMHPTLTLTALALRTAEVLERSLR